MPNFVLQSPSLQHLAGIKTVAALWNHPDILELIAELSEESQEDDLDWNAVREKVESHALALELTQPCKQQLLKFIKPLGREIFHWCYNQYSAVEDNFDFPLLRCLLPRKFCWTMHGTVDYAKTAQLMVKDESLVLERRYDLACINCLEDEARELFESMDEEPRQEYSNSSIRSERNEHENLIAYFSNTLSGDVDRLKNALPKLIASNLSINDYLFVRSLYSSNRATS